MSDVVTTIPSVRTVVSERIAKSGPEVAEKVIEHLATREVNRRTDAVLKGFDKLEELEKEFRKLRPDVVSYDEAGKVANSTWSAEQLKKRNELKQKIEKLTNTIDRALVKEDYSDLYNLINQK